MCVKLKNPFRSSISYSKVYSKPQVLVDCAGLVHNKPIMNFLWWCCIILLWPEVMAYLILWTSQPFPGKVYFPSISNNIALSIVRKHHYSHMVQSGIFRIEERCSGLVCHQTGLMELVIFSDTRSDPWAQHKELSLSTLYMTQKQNKQIKLIPKSKIGSSYLNDELLIPGLQWLTVFN